MAHTKKSKKSQNNFVLVFMGAIFFCMGCFFMWFMGLKPLMLSIQSNAWPQVICTVIGSKLESRSDSDSGTTYKAVVTVHYSYDGLEYDGGSYDFNDAYSSGRGGKERVVAAYPVGKQASCWVNPKGTQQAVLDRGIPSIVWFVIPFSSIFVLVGAVLLVVALGFHPKAWLKSTHERVVVKNRGYITLLPTHGVGGKALGFGFMAAFWNGIVGAFVFTAYEGFAQNKPEWGLTLFLIPFVLAGLLLGGLFIRAILAMFNPKASLSLSEGSPKLGQQVILQWGFRGKVERIKQLTIVLEGRESARYRVGTNTRTDTHIFYTKELLSTDTVWRESNKNLSIEIPSDSMHSFTSSNNAIEWVVKLHGDIPKWADVDDEYPITVRPV